MWLQLLGYWFGFVLFVSIVWFLLAIRRFKKRSIKDRVVSLRDGRGIPGPCALFCLDVPFQLIYLVGRPRAPRCPAGMCVKFSKKNPYLGLRVVKDCCEAQLQADEDDSEGLLVDYKWIKGALSTILVDYRPDESPKFAKYLKLYGYPESTKELPLLFPECVLFPFVTELALMMPLNMFGAVHMGNRTIQRRAMRVDETYRVQIYLCALRKVYHGFEFDFTFTFRSDEDDEEDPPCWESVSTFLAFFRHRGERPERTRPSISDGDWDDVDRSASEWATDDMKLALKGNAGRKYAAISLDWNPIHVAAITAKLFGFKRTIAHGMFVQGKILQNIPGETMHRYPITHRCYFRRPVLLPSKSVVKYFDGPNGSTIVEIRDTRKDDLLHMAWVYPGEMSEGNPF